MQKKEFFLSIVNGVVIGLITYFQIRILPTFFDNFGVEEYRSLFGLPVLILVLEFLALKFAVKKNPDLLFYVISYVIAVALVIAIFVSQPQYFFYPFVH